MAQVTGVCIIKVNGGTILTKEGSSMKVGGFERTAQYADNGLIGFSQKPVAATISGTLAHTSDNDILALRDLKDATITFETDSGVVFVIANAFCTDPPELSSGEGEVKVEFMGQAAVLG